MSLIPIGPPCSVCGKPANMVVNLDSATAPRFVESSEPVRAEPRCDEHNPFLSKCPRGHAQFFSQNYCGECGAPMHESLRLKQ